MRKWKFLASLLLAAAALAFLGYRILPELKRKAPTYDWECNQCHYRFRHTVASVAADLPQIDCPKCKAATAERIMHYQCRKCWKKYDLRGSKATLANIICPGCGSQAARDLDHPIPGDDEPIDGGLPFPAK